MRIISASFIGRDCLEAQADDVVGVQGFEDDRIDAGLESARLLGLECLANSFMANARRIEPGNVKMVAQEIARAAPVRSARGHRKADQAGTAVMKIAMFGSEAGGGAVGMVKTCADDARFFARSNDF